MHTRTRWSPPITKGPRWWLLGLLLLALLPASSPTHAQTTTGLTLTAAAGFDGLFREQAWLPVSVSVTNNGPPVSGYVRIVVDETAFGSDQVIYDLPIELPTQSSKRVTHYVFADTFRTTLDVSLVDEAGALLHPTVVAGPLRRIGIDDLLTVVVGDSAGVLAFLEDVHGGRPDGAVAFMTLDALPDVAAAWRAIDVLVLSDVDTSRFSAEQRALLGDWIDGGGALVVTGGSGAAQTSAAVRDWLPVTLEAVVTVDQLPALADVAGIPLPEAGPYLVSGSRLTTGDLLVHQDGLPLLAVRPLGQGHVFWLALDPAAAPLRGWAGGPDLWAPVAGVVPSATFWTRGIQSPYPIDQAVRRLPGVGLPPAPVIIGFMLLYAVVVGPLNFWWLKRRARPEAMWWTVPLVALVFTGLVFVTGFRLQGGELIAHQLSVVYGADQGQSQRVQTVVGFYAPRRGTYDLMFPEGVLVRPFGPVGGAGSAETRLERTAAVTARGVNIEVGGLRTYLVDSRLPGNTLSGSARLLRDDRQIALAASLRNNGDVPLENVVALFNNEAVPLGDIPPGERLEVTRPLVRTTAAAPVSGPASDLYAGILGTPDYYVEPAVFTRFQLLESITANPYAFTPGPSASLPTAAAVAHVTVVAWSEQPLLPTTAGSRSVENVGTTLHIVELPLTQELIRGADVVIPPALVGWRLVDSSAGYGIVQSLRDLFLAPGDSLTYEFFPTPGFESLTLTGFEIKLEKQPYAELQPVPQVQAWDWTSESWEEVDGVAWDAAVRVGIGRFASPDQLIRLRLLNPSTVDGAALRSLDVSLVGNME